MSSHSEVDLTGKVLGDFKVLRRLGQGGMGHVYLAEQISLRRQVALKMLRPDLAANPTSLKRFQAEALAVAKATHANIVQVYAVGDHEGLYYMALEFIEGRNLREYLEKKGPPDVLLGLSIIRQVAAALQRASELGIIHRDIKPDNILVTRKGEVKVADFGLCPVFDEATGQPANLTQPGTAIGTPLYMSPEQVEGKPLDTRTDIYSFGVTCYHMFAGHPPFRGSSPFEVAAQHVQKEPQPLQEIRFDLPLELCAIIHKMMSKRPENRYQTGREIGRDVARLRDAVVSATVGVGATATDSTSNLTASQPVRELRFGRPRRLLFAAIPAALACGLGLGWIWNHVGTSGSDASVAKPVNGQSAIDKAALLRKEKENEMLKQLREHMNAGKPKELKVGLYLATDLATVYVKDKRWDEADALFKDLDKPDRVGPYQYIGKLGKAIALAFKDEPAESNKQFLALLDRERVEKSPTQLVRSNPALRELIAKALHHNLANDPKAFPKKLEGFLAPPAPTLKTQTPEK